MTLKFDRKFARGRGGSSPPGRIAVTSYRPGLGEDPLVDTVLDGRYRIVGRLGEGAMSTVYKATHEAVGRTVAVKILKKGLSMDPSTTKRFQREAKAISALSHPNLIVVHDFGTTESGQPFQVIEYIQGRSLGEIIAESGQVEPARAARLFAQICDAMQHAHDQGIIHRDLKPENIMVINSGNRQDFVKVVDFGIVKLTEDSQLKSQRLTMTGQVWGSPLYASPEQCMGRDLDGRSDVYSLGLVLYETLAGRPAISGKNIGQIALKHIKEKPPAFAAVVPHLSIPAPLEAIVFRAVEKEPLQRFQSMAEMRDALAGFAGRGTGGEPAPAQSLRPAPAPVRPEAMPDVVEGSQPVSVSVEDVYAYQQRQTPQPAAYKSLRQSAPQSAWRPFPLLPVIVVGVLVAVAVLIFVVMSAGKH